MRLLTLIGFVFLKRFSENITKKLGKLFKWYLRVNENAGVFYLLRTLT